MVEIPRLLERFTRGVTKLEPELLDELGIFVKLDEAYEQYAIALNVNQLTVLKNDKLCNALLTKLQEIRSLSE